jgi:hypothetical protein
MLTQASGPTYYARLQFADAPSCVAWLETLPLERTAEAHEMVSAQVGLVARSALPPLEKLRILELLYQTAAYLQNALAGRYLGCALPLSIVEYSVWRTVVELWQALFEAYEHALQSAVAGDAALKVHGPLLALRSIELTASVVREHHRVYREVPGALWLRLHTLYATAERHGLATQGVPDPLAPAGQVRTPMAAYGAAALNQLSNPYAMSQRQMKFMYRWTALWEALVRVSPMPHSPGAAGGLALDLRKGVPALPATRVEAGPSVRYLDLEQLGQALRRVLALLRQGHPPEALGLGPDCRQPGCERLLTLLYIQWCGGGMGPFAEQGERGEDARAFVGFGRILRQLPGGASASERMGPLSVAAASDCEHWHLAGTSAPGFVAVARGPECDERVQHHQLVALGRRTHTHLQLAVVQWMRLEESAELSLGLRLLAGVPSRTTLHELATGGEMSIETGAILLPAAPELRTPATLLTAPGFFGAGREVALAPASGTPTRVRLLRLLERGVDFERTVFETVA